MGAKRVHFFFSKGKRNCLQFRLVAHRGPCPMTFEEVNLPNTVSRRFICTLEGKGLATGLGRSEAAFAVRRYSPAA